MRPALDQAQHKAEEANQLYASMRDASLVNDSMASLFTTPPDPASNDPDSKEGSPKVMKRADFNARSPKDRLAFVNAGGTIED
jgi:hypothetical protein